MFHWTAPGRGVGGRFYAAAVEETTWLDVPYEDKDAAKAAGARWNPQHRRWYAPRSEMAALQQWQARPDLPTLLPGEDRTFGSGLFVDPVPESGWFTNVRSCTDARDWDRLRRMIYDRADNACEACGRTRDPAQALWLDAHERWAYDTAAGVQRLTRLVSLCSPCHLATHFGFAQVTGREDEAMLQLMYVNDWDWATARDHVDASARLWADRSRLDWDLDLSMLTDAGIALAELPGARQRRLIAEASWQVAHTASARQSTTNVEEDDSPPPDWYPDPRGEFELRWWDGAAWTNHIADADGRQRSILSDPAARLPDLA